MIGGVTPPSMHSSAARPNSGAVLLTLILALAWILNPSFGPSPIILQTLMAASAALLWFLLRPVIPQPAALVLACSWLFAAVFNAGVGVAQYFSLIPESTAWFSASSGGEVYGNLRQRNQLATLLAIGLASAFYLLTQLEGRLRWGLAVCVVLLSAVSALTSSRTGMLHWILLCGIALLAPLWGAPAWWRGWALLAAGSYAVGPRAHDARTRGGWPKLCEPQGAVAERAAPVHPAPLDGLGPRHARLRALRHPVPR